MVAVCHIPSIGLKSQRTPTSMAVQEPHILKASSNTRRLITNLKGVLDEDAIALLEGELDRQVVLLFSLATDCLSFATGPGKKDWRLCVSRLYYACYHASRALRLSIFGEWSDEVKDHKKIVDLPDSFPQRSRYQTELPVLRSDRNLCDYDHDSSEADLAIGVAESISLAGSFVADCKNTLESRGIDFATED